MAGTVTVDIENPRYISEGYKRFPCKITVDWTSDGDGDATGNLAALFSAAKADYEPTLTAIKGLVRSTQTIPGEEGDLTTDLPSDEYDLTITDAYGEDILNGAGANRSGTASQVILQANTRIIDSELAISISNAGDSKKGRIIIMLGE